MTKNEKRDVLFAIGQWLIICSIPPFLKYLKTYNSYGEYMALFGSLIIGLSIAFNLIYAYYELDRL